MVAGYRIFLLHNDNISEVHSFIKEEHCTESGIEEEVLNEKRGELILILKDIRDSDNPDRVRGFVDCLYNNSTKGEKTPQNLSDLERGYFLKFKQDPFHNYLIIKEGADNVLSLKEQAGLSLSLFCSRKNINEDYKHHENDLCIKWIDENGGKFSEIFRESYIEKLSRKPYKVYKNLERNISKLIEKRSQQPWP